MRKLSLLVIAVLATILIGACGADDSGLVGKDWQLTAITGKVPDYQGSVPVAEQSRYTITFSAEGTFAAVADCNAVAGTYTTTNGPAA